MALPQRHITIAIHKVSVLLPPGRIVLAVGDEAVVVHARLGVHLAAALVDAVRLGAVLAVVVLQTSLLSLGALVRVPAMLAVRVQLLAAKVVDDGPPDVPHGLGRLREVDDAVADDVALHARDLVSPLAAQHVQAPPEQREVVVGVVRGDSAEEVGFDVLAALAEGEQGPRNGKVDPHCAGVLVIDAVVAPQRDVGVVVLFKVGDVVRLDRNGLVPNKGDGRGVGGLGTCSDREGVDIVFLKGGDVGPWIGGGQGDEEGKGSEEFHGGGQFASTLVNEE